MRGSRANVFQVFEDMALAHTTHGRSISSIRRKVKKSANWNILEVFQRGTSRVWLNFVGTMARTEFSGGSRTIQVDSDFTISWWQECDLLERPIGAVASGDFQMELGAYQIRSFLIVFESSVP